MKRRLGTWSSKKGQGRGIKWIRDHASYQNDACLIWPFSRIKNGYGNFGFNGKIYYAHRYMCEVAHGPPPTPEHEASHSCGRGHDGCANPNHLSWKTPSANTREGWQHTPGTRNHWGSRGRLTPDQVLTIRELRGKKTQAEIAAIFNMSEPSVRDIYLGRTYKHVIS